MAGSDTRPADTGETPPQSGDQSRRRRDEQPESPPRTRASADRGRGEGSGADPEQRPGEESRSGSSRSGSGQRGSERPAEPRKQPPAQGQPRRKASGGKQASSGKQVSGTAASPDAKRAPARKPASRRQTTGQQPGAGASTGRTMPREQTPAAKRPPPIGAIRRPSERKYRQRVTGINLWSVAKVSVCFYLCALIVVLVAGIVVWLVASAAGAVGNIEEFMQEAGFDDFRFLSGQILRGAVLIGLAMVVVMTILTLVGAALYNLFAELIGGVELLVREDEDARD